MKLVNDANSELGFVVCDLNGNTKNTLRDILYLVYSFSIVELWSSFPLVVKLSHLSQHSNCLLCLFI